MNPRSPFLLLVSLACISYSPRCQLMAQETATADLPIILLNDTFDLSTLKTREATAALVSSPSGGKALQINFARSDKFPDVAFSPQNGSWDFSKFGGVRFAITNTGTQGAKVAVRVDNEGKPQEKRWNTAGETIPPGQTKIIEVRFGLNKQGKPDYPLDASKIVAVRVFALKPGQETPILVNSIEAFGAPAEGAVETGEASSPGAPRSKPLNTKPSEPVLFGFEGPEVLSRITGLDSKFELVEGKEGKSLQVELGTESPYPNVTFKAPESNWNLERFTRVEMSLTNNGDESLQLGARVDNPGATGKSASNRGKITLDPGKTGTMTVDLDRFFAEEMREKLAGMRYTPWGARADHGGMIDPANIVQMNIFANKPVRPLKFTVNSIRASGEFDPNTQVIPEPFFPFVDRFGQYMHKDWLNKVKSESDLTKARADELASINQFPRPANWNIYGGWATGPQLEKKGHFYTTKQNGKWFLVDPDGRLFFSVGMDVVQVGQAGTPIDEREGWFAESPWENPDFKEFADQAKDVKHGAYKGKTPRVFNFYGANLRRKYGADWQETWRQLMPQRLMNWGFNTIGNWSDPKINSQQKIPYTHWVFYFPKRLPWQPNTRNPIPDVFEPGFEEAVRTGAIKMTKGTIDDPWCIGYFVDNELSWQDDDTQGKAAMAGGASSAAKMELLRDLEAKYGKIEKLNDAWKSSFVSWEAMQEDKTEPKTVAGREDLRVFTEKLTRKYFATVSKVLKEVAPKKLYLGCRFADHNPQVAKIAAEFCDVVSFNIYRESIAAWKPVAAIDTPVIIGEFHFGATDRGVFGPGLVKAKDSADRAVKFFDYVTGAAKNPQIVGTHWFALVDEPTTGRALDGENYNIGFMSITDTPYKEMIEASRKAAAEIYRPTISR